MRALETDSDFVIQYGVLTKYIGTGGDVVIPDGVTSIGHDAFYGCSGLASMTVESGNPAYDSRNDCNAVIDTGGEYINSRV